MAPGGTTNDKPDINGCVVVVVVFAIPVMTAVPNVFHPFATLMAPGSPFIAEVLKKAVTSFRPFVLQILSIPVIVTGDEFVFRKLKVTNAFELLLRNPEVETPDVGLLILGVTVIVPVTGKVVAFVAVKAAILPVPLAARPMDGVLFVQLNTVPATVLVKFTGAVIAPLHTV